MEHLKLLELVLHSMSVVRSDALSLEGISDANDKRESSYRISDRYDESSNSDNGENQKLSVHIFRKPFSPRHRRGKYVAATVLTQSIELKRRFQNWKGDELLK